MHILQASARRAKAEKRINAAATYLAKKFKLRSDLVKDLSIQQKDVMAKQVLEAESMANLLEAVVDKISKEASRKDKEIAAKGAEVPTGETEVPTDEPETPAAGE